MTEMTTKFDEDGLPLAANHAGWNVQRLDDCGWVVRNNAPIQSKSDAREIMKFAQSLNPSKEYRVYEALFTS